MNIDKNRFRRLLVIDDNEAIHDDIKKIFATEDDNGLDELDALMFGSEPTEKIVRWNYELSFASQGKAGLEILKSNHQAGRSFGAAFVDMRMPPGWDGVETIENLWKVDPDLQVVICTAFSDHSWDDITKRLGLSDQLLILKKPFDEIEVVQLAASLTEKRRLLEESKTRLENLENVVVDQGTELQAAHKDAELLISSISSMLISLDENGIVSRWNPIAVNLFGIAKEDAIGTLFQDLPIQWEDPDALKLSLRECCMLQEKQFEFQFVDNAGVMRTLDMMICPILNDPASSARLILASDVTIQKALKVQLDQALRLESVGQLAAGVAHEINTPMQYIGDNVRYVAKSFERIAPILDCLPVLADPNITDEQLRGIRNQFPANFKIAKLKSSLEQIPEALGDSIEGVMAVSKIVAAMKEFSHPGSEQKSQVCVNHIIESTITVAKNEWKYVADIETELEEELVPIAALPSELNQAFLNIIVNAAHAIGDRVAKSDFAKGFLKITTKSHDDYVEISIEDNGGGIPLKARDRVFEPFFTTKDVGKGTGQGLAIAYAVIVQKHGGKIWFDVEDGVGTTFHIQLPCHEPQTDEQTEDELEAETSQGAVI